VVGLLAASFGVAAGAVEIESDRHGKAAWAPAVDPKPLSEETLAGLHWLVESQNADGGWNQGEEAAGMRASMKDPNTREVSNVADSSLAALALIRAGEESDGGGLLHAKPVERAVEFVCGGIEEADGDSLAVTSLRGTRLQTKIGTYVDTFLASLFLAEAKERLVDGKLRDRAAAALDKVLAKIEKNQREDGSFEGSGWATDLSQSIAGKGINRAAQTGAEVSGGVRARSEASGRDKYDAASGTFGSKTSAGVELYAAATALAQMQDNANTNVLDKAKALEQLAAPASAPVREKAEAELDRIAKNEADLDAARKEVVAKLRDDKRFISGFGSNGGEEFLSYMNLGESLVVAGGQAWEEWDREMTRNLNRIQNQDGTWSGEHCITGRTFCTSAALLVLMVDRAPVPLAADLKRR